ncbi:alpha/beta hydrolase family protein [Chitinophaga nivalis]|uniref:Alpha/beta fold hydrolase n=1 Tax=Chitinophaga nivalis TaxID=2991709 RepID=A0ABT3INF7_9BACT|nr:alpha/beta fold hydrolase [Chitinophaga nivalis]MCW3464988.1 alpha/beta fold hydrolase [Chitinophaga nivalis]MCW3485320.1 alpha/beta fold hydrolase [Chitinophaga nivalis]
MEKVASTIADLSVIKTLSTPVPVISVSPVILSVPGRGNDLQVRISAPVTGNRLPIILFAHGFGSSSEGYAPLANFWAAHGFIVIQPTFLDSRMLGIPHEDPRTPLIWRFRVDDMKCILDQLDLLEDAVPQLKDRSDRSRIAAVGHSFGAHTSGLLLGARLINADGSLGEDWSDPRIKAGVLLCASGRGGEDLSPFAAEHLPYINQSYAGLTTQTLVVAGDQDNSPLTVRGPDWFTDAYTLSPGAHWLATLFGGEHLLGGISGYLVTETSDENPARVAAVQQLTWAYLRSALYPEDPAWETVRTWFMAHPDALGRVDGK